MRKFTGQSFFTLLFSLLGCLAIAVGGCRPVAKPLVETANPPTTVAPPKVVIIRPMAATPTTPLPTSTPLALQATSTPTPALPEEHYIRNINGHRQYFPLGCEAATAKDWANYFGKDFNEFVFQYKLPISDNPDLGFVGNVNSPWGQVPPYAYGVYAGPLAALLNAYGIPAKAYKGYSLDQIKAKIAGNKPVITWVIGNVVGGVPAEYTDAQGNKTIVAAYEHVVIITGYNKDHVRYMNNGRFYETPNQVFLNSWEVLGNMVVVDN